MNHYPLKTINTFFILHLKSYLPLCIPLPTIKKHKLARSAPRLGVIGQWLISKSDALKKELKPTTSHWIQYDFQQIFASKVRYSRKWQDHLHKPTLTTPPLPAKTPDPPPAEDIFTSRQLHIPPMIISLLCTLLFNFDMFVNYFLINFKRNDSIPVF